MANKVTIIRESDLSPFEKWWRDHTIDWDRSFSFEERALAEAAFEAGARLGRPTGQSHRRH
ncbi:hypothetical protein [Mesorhizobium sp. M8A.F.Ca.ET.021.01.1.1]|uniref:hypothetical protein n=1 Tax=Mesorhizobium sp. M8A.F.Ca.ET.021.01.1.1 TaxID=2496757 RepID=UPI000FCACB0D|nr:hypothetical protein [Mesorhizobium sp. M8A.F.Ca.ET.021.01.1.1]RUW56843.1 hypothetical protein EOA36_02265 [Mesorhizobium sp. M8A.F.Ca.ET.021.01.1.1]